LHTVKVNPGKSERRIQTRVPSGQKRLTSFSRIVTLGGIFLLFAASCTPRRNGIMLSAPPNVSPSAAADNDIYLADATGNIRALSADGKEEWSYTLSNDLVRLESEASHDIRIDHLAARSAGKLFGLATQETGRQAGRTYLFALNEDHLAWYKVVAYPEQGVSPIAIGQKAVYEAGDDGKLYAFARDDGHPLWKYDVSAGPIGSPTVGADETIYIAGPRHNLHAISPDGTQKWVLETQK
jgi:outer membrane protein assembly factor BamB